MVNPKPNADLSARARGHDRCAHGRPRLGPQQLRKLRLAHHHRPHHQVREVRRDGIRRSRPATAGAQLSGAELATREGALLDLGVLNLAVLEICRPVTSRGHTHMACRHEGTCWYGVHCVRGAWTASVGGVWVAHGLRAWVAWAWAHS